MEILAPAGGMEHLVAAVRSGADAVYLGTGNFNARRNAPNFDEKTLKEAVSYCHVRSVKVYVTLNTLVLDREMDSLSREIGHIAESGADGAIVQDPGVAVMVKAQCPALALHASTQMTVHNISGAKALEDLGFTRVVLARELSREELIKIAETTKLELEVFVHGALCMSVSGQCYLSSMLGERSGNRGLCAQPCRLNFTSGSREYALSLKDLSLTSHIGELEDAGVSALKIEGRMKRPEYVAVAVTACKAAMRGEKPDMQTLRSVFSRSGFTDGYFTGKRELDMFGSRTKEDVLSADSVLSGIAAGYRMETPLVPVDLHLSVQRDSPAILTVSDGTRTAVQNGSVPEEAVSRPLTEESARQSMQKTGGTPFFLRSFSSSIGDGLMLRISELNRLRKESLEQLLRTRGEINPLPFYPENSPAAGKRRIPSTREPELRIRLFKPSQITDYIAENARKIILPAEEIASYPGLIARFPEKLVGELPLMVFPGAEDRLRNTLEDLRKEGLKAVIAGYIGTVRMAKELGFAVFGDYSLNVTNSFSCSVLQSMGVSDLTLSFELNLKQAKALRADLPLGLLAYGRLPLMTFRNCPARAITGCAGCSGETAIRDRMRNSFPVTCRKSVYAQLLNALPLYMGDKAAELYGLDFATLYFTVEDAAQCENIVRLYEAHTPYPGNHTRALYFRDLK